MDDYDRRQWNASLQQQLHQPPLPLASRTNCKAFVLLWLFLCTLLGLALVGIMKAGGGRSLIPSPAVNGARPYSEELRLDDKEDRTNQQQMLPSPPKAAAGFVSPCYHHRYRALPWNTKFRIFKLTMERLCHHLPKPRSSYDEFEHIDDVVDVFFEHILELIPSWASPPPEENTNNKRDDLRKALYDLENEHTLAPMCPAYHFRQLVFRPAKRFSSE